MAHKKGVGSSRNGRDSNPKYRGIKKYGGEFVTAGNIIARQCGRMAPRPTGACHHTRSTRWSTASQFQHHNSVATRAACCGGVQAMTGRSRGGLPLVVKVAAGPHIAGAFARSILVLHGLQAREQPSTGALK